MENENNNDPVDQIDDASGKNDDASKDSVSHDSFMKALSEKKSAQASNAKLEAENKAFKEEQLKREGKSEELISLKDKRIEELEGKLSKSDKAYAWKTLTGEIKRKATEQGCTNPDKLIRLMSDEDLQSIEIGEDFSISSDSLKRVIDKNKKENHFLFGNTNKKSANGNPNNSKVVDNETDLSKMSLDDIKALHKKNANK